MFAVFVLMLCLALISRSFRHSLRAWFHSKYGLRVTFESLERKETPGTLFDAFITYSRADDIFVTQVLATELEVTNKYRICLHHRDLPSSPGTSHADALIRGSERTIVVFSTNLLQSEWSMFDYKAGLLQAVNQRGNIVLFTLLGDINTTLLDPYPFQGTGTIPY